MEEIKFVYDKELQKLNEDLDSLLLSVKDPLVGAKISLLNLLTEGMVRALARQSGAVSRERFSEQKQVLVPRGVEEKSLSASYLTLFPPVHVGEDSAHQKAVQGGAFYEGVLSEKPLPPLTPSQASEEESLLREEPAEPTRSHEGESEVVDLIVEKKNNLVITYAEVNKGRYEVVEPDLDEEEKKLLDAVRVRVKNPVKTLNDPEVLNKLFIKMARKKKVLYDPQDFVKLRYYLVKHLLQLGLIDPLLCDAKITRISCDGLDVPLRVVRDGREYTTNITYVNPHQLSKVLVSIARKCGKEVSMENPILEARCMGFVVRGALGHGEIPSTFVMERERVTST